MAPSSARWASPRTASSGRTRAAPSWTSRPRNGLEVDGIVGPITTRALGLGRRAGRARRAAAPNAATTMALQRALGIAADGVYGPMTRAAVRRLPAPPRAGGGRHRRPGHARRARRLRQHPGASVRAGGGGAGSAVAAARSKLGAPYALGGEGPAAGTAPASRSGRWPRPASRSRARATTSSAPARPSTAPRSRPATSCSSTPTARAPRTSAIATSNATVISATTHGVREHAIGGDVLGRALRRRRRSAGANFAADPLCQ